MSGKVTIKNIDPDESPNKFSFKASLLQSTGDGGGGKEGGKEEKEEGRKKGVKKGGRGREVRRGRDSGMK